MVRVVNAPELKFDCPSCRAQCVGEEKDFRALHTMPPLWEVNCGYCNQVVRVSPQPLVAKLVGSM